MANYIKTNIVNSNEEHIYPITKSELVITESGIPLEVSIESKAEREDILRFAGVNNQGFSQIERYDAQFRDWRPLGQLDVGVVENTWPNDREAVLTAIQGVQADLTNRAPMHHSHSVGDITDIHLVTDRITHLELNPTPGPQGLPGTNGTNGTNGVTPRIDMETRTWWIGPQNTNIIAEGRDGADFTSRWEGQSFVAIGSTLTFQNGLVSGANFDGYPTQLIRNLNFVNSHTFAEPSRLIADYPAIIGNINMNLYQLAIIEIGTADFYQSTPIDEFAQDLERCVAAVRASNPFTAIMFLTPVRTSEGVNILGHGLIDYIRQIYRISNLYAIPVCDLYHNSGITPRTATTFMAGGGHLTQPGLTRVGTTIVGSVHMFNGSGSVMVDEELEEDEYEEEEEFSSEETVLLIPYLDDELSITERTFRIQEIFNLAHDRPIEVKFGPQSGVNGLVSIHTIDVLPGTKVTIHPQANVRFEGSVGFNMDNHTSISGGVVHMAIGGATAIQSEGHHVNVDNVIVRNGRSIFTNAQNLTYSGVFEQVTGIPLQILACNRVDVQRVTFQGITASLTLIEILGGDGIFVDKIFTRGQVTTSSVVRMGNYGAVSPQRVQIGNGIHAGDIQHFVSQIDRPHVIQPGRREMMWSGQWQGGTIPLWYNINEFKDIRLHLLTGEVVPATFHNGVFDFNSTFMQMTPTRQEFWGLRARFVASGDTLAITDNQAMAISFNDL